MLCWKLKEYEIKNGYFQSISTVWIARAKQENTTLHVQNGRLKTEFGYLVTFLIIN